jgi:hypothetical protein
MGLQLNKEAYTKLIKEDIAYLDIYAKDALERDHIKQVLLDSITLIYDRHIVDKEWPDRDIQIWGLDDVIDRNK